MFRFGVIPAKVNNTLNSRQVVVGCLWKMPTEDAYVTFLFSGRVVDRMGIPRLHGPRLERHVSGDHLARGVAAAARIRADLAPERADSYPPGPHSGEAAGNRRRVGRSGVARVATDRRQNRGVSAHQVRDLFSVTRRRSESIWAV